MSELIANGQVGFREFEDKLKTVCRFNHSSKPLGWICY